MTSVPVTRTSPLRRLYWTFSDGYTVVRRDLGHLRHAPGLLVVELVFPILMIVMFGYVFGSAIPVPGGGNYREYLMPGLFAMISTTGIVGTMGVVASDMGKGVMDRFRSMPIARSAVPFGQTGSEVITGFMSMVVMVVCGLAVGWRIHNGVGPAIGAFALLVLFRYSVTWVGVFLGMLAKNEATADKLTPLVFPFTMISNVFVPTDGMEPWLRAIAEWNPVSAVVAACRQLFGNPGRAVAHQVAWPLEHPVIASAGWSILLLLIFVPLSVRRYRTVGR
jgi:ABC-2 type transport system permease protein